MEFEWDHSKAASNYRKHGVTFEYATRVFWKESAPVIVTDDRKAYGEKRYCAFGEVEGRLFIRPVAKVEKRKKYVIPA